MSINNRGRTADFVRAARAKLKMTQAQLAEQVGKQRWDIAKYETKRATPPGDVILKISDLLDKG